MTQDFIEIIAMKITTMDHTGKIIMEISEEIVNQTTNFIQTDYRNITTLIIIERIDRTKMIVL